MSTVLAVATGTGNSLFVADRIKHDYLYFAEDLISGNESLPDDMDRLGIIFPVYCGGIPHAVLRFIEEVLSDRDNSGLGYIFAIVTNGGLPLNALSDLDRTLQDNGLALSYGKAVRMPDAYLPLQKKAVSKEKAEEIARKAEEKLKAIAEDTDSEKIEIPGKGFLYRTVRRFSRLASAPRPNEKLGIDSAKCIHCMTCVRICPEGNIKEENGRIIIGDSCISCFACYHRCPEMAITYPGAKGQYKGLVETSRLFRR